MAWKESMRLDMSKPPTKAAFLGELAKAPGTSTERNRQRMLWRMVGTQGQGQRWKLGKRGAGAPARTQRPPLKRPEKRGRRGRLRLRSRRTTESGRATAMKTTTATATGTTTTAPAPAAGSRITRTATRIKHRGRDSWREGLRSGCRARARSGSRRLRCTTGATWSRPD